MTLNSTTGKPNLDKRDPPNILFFITHDTGKYFSCYESPVRTPNIDRIGQNGVIFDNHFCSAPQCTPSRGSILTGKYPHVNGLMGLTNLGWNLPEKNITLPKIFSQHGYTSHLIGLQHTHKDATKLGYDSVSRRSDFPYFAATVKRRVKKFFKQVEKGEIQQPFFCNVGFFETHRPFDEIAQEKYLTPLDKVQLPPYLPDDPKIRKEIAEFEAILRELDHRIGQILDSFEKTSFKENTIVVFTVDHGWAFPRAKGTLYDPGLRTALLMHWPGKIEGGKHYKELVSNVDLLPTLLEFAGITIPTDLQSDIQGRSLKNLLNNQSFTPREYIFGELTHHDQGYNPIRCIRSQNWKYIRNFTNFNNVQFQIPADILNEAESGKAYIQHHPEYSQSRPDEELYNLDTDPNEFENVANDPQYTEIKEKLKKRLMEELEATNDPILKGPVPAPQEPEFFTY